VDAPEHPSEASLVAQRVLARRERQELSDVGAADERLVAGAAQHQHADPRIVIEALTEIVEAFVHLERHGVARIGTVEGDPGDPPRLIEPQVLVGGVGHGSKPKPSAYHSLSPPCMIKIRRKPR